MSSVSHLLQFTNPLEEYVQWGDQPLFNRAVGEVKTWVWYAKTIDLSEGALDFEYMLSNGGLTGNNINAFVVCGDNSGADQLNQLKLAIGGDLFNSNLSVPENSALKVFYLHVDTSGRWYTGFCEAGETAVMSGAMTTKNVAVNNPNWSQGHRDGGTAARGVKNPLGGMFVCLEAMTGVKLQALADGADFAATCATALVEVPYNEGLAGVVTSSLPTGGSAITGTLTNFADNDAAWLSLAVPKPVINIPSPIVNIEVGETYTRQVVTAVDGDGDPLDIATIDDSTSDIVDNSKIGKYIERLTIESVDNSGTFSNVGIITVNVLAAAQDITFLPHEESFTIKESTSSINQASRTVSVRLLVNGNEDDPALRNFQTYFGIDKASGGAPITFKVRDGDLWPGNNTILPKHMWSYDKINWTYFDNISLTGSPSQITFSNDEPFTQDTVYIAHMQPYSQFELEHHMQIIRDAESPYVHDFVNGTDLVAGTHPAGTALNGIVYDETDIFGFIITDYTDPSTSGNKKIVWITGGVHTQEALGKAGVLGIADFLQSSHVDAIKIRKEYIVNILVNTFADGAVSGMCRSFATSNENPNRYWDDETIPSMGRILTIIENQSTKAHVHFDFHATPDVSEDVECYILDGTYEADALKLVLDPALDANTSVNTVVYTISGGNGVSSNHYFSANQLASITATSEISSPQGKSDAEIRNIGVAYVKALADDNIINYIEANERWVPSENSAPVVNITSNTSDADAGEVVIFTANVTDVNSGDIHSFLWSTGETTQSISVAAPVNSTDSQLVISCVANDGFVDSNLAEKTINVAAEVIEPSSPAPPSSGGVSIGNSMLQNPINIAPSLNAQTTQIVAATTALIAQAQAAIDALPAVIDENGEAIDAFSIASAAATEAAKDDIVAGLTAQNAVLIADNEASKDAIIASLTAKNDALTLAVESRGNKPVVTHYSVSMPSSDAQEDVSLLSTLDRAASFITGISFRLSSGTNYGASEIPSVSFFDDDTVRIQRTTTAHNVVVLFSVVENV